MMIKHYDGTQRLIYTKMIVDIDGEKSKKNI